MKLNVTKVALLSILWAPLLAFAQNHPSGSQVQTSHEQAATLSVDMSNPYALIRDVSAQAFGLLKRERDIYAKDPEKLRNVAADYFMPYINVRYAALKVLGPAARKATRAQRDAFTEAFYQYMIASYAQILTQYSEQNVIVEKAQPIDSNRKVVSVRVDIQDASRPPIRMDFKLRKNNKTNEWQGFDVQVEGVSMLETKASEWSRIIRKEGIDKVTSMLLESAKKPIAKEEASS